MAKLLLISVVSWLAAVASFSAYAWVAGGRASMGDVVSLLVWGGFATLTAVAVAFAPAMFAMRKRFRNVWLFVAAGAGLAVVPLLLFAALWGSVANLISGIGALLFGVFTVFGTCFGAGFYWNYVRNSDGRRWASEEPK